MIRIIIVAAFVVVLLMGLAISTVVLRKRFMLRGVSGSVLLVVHAFANLGLTVFGRVPYSAAYEPNLRLFQSYQTLVSYGSVERVVKSFLFVQIILNVLLYMPLGALLPFVWPGRFRTSRYMRDLFFVLTVGFICSVCVEACQWAFKIGYPEIDDVFHNVLGAGLGYVTYRALSHIMNTLSRRLCCEGSACCL